MKIIINCKLINRGWDNLRTFIFDNKLLVCCIGAYLCFDKTLESLFAAYLLPIMKGFTVSMMSTVVLVILLVCIIADFFRKYQKRILVSNQTVGFWLFMLFLWGKYRLGADSAYISYIPFLCYVDFIPVLTGKYLILRLFRSVSMKGEISSDGFLADEPITRSEDDLLGRKIYAHDAAEKLLATNTEKNAFTFGVVAPWGNGKTSFLYMLKEHIDNNWAGDVVTISFHPWKYGKSSNLTYLFFEELSKSLAPYSTSFSYDS